MAGWLIRFPRFIAAMEKLGNISGRLSFLIANGIILGASTENIHEDQFLYCVTIVVLEASRYISLHLVILIYRYFIGL